MILKKLDSHKNNNSQWNLLKKTENFKAKTLIENFLYGFLWKLMQLKKNCFFFLLQLKNLKAFIHVSTAYCHCHEPVLEERAYPTDVSPESILSLVQTTSDELLEKMTPDLIGKEPNTYAFSKVLSEDLVSRSGLPVGIARPSIGNDFFFFAFHQYWEFFKVFFVVLF